MRRDLVWWAVPAAVAALLYRHLWDLPVLGQDEAATLLYPMRVLEGDLPHRDFETFYGPLGVYLLSPLYQAFGHHLEVERLVAVGYILCGAWSVAAVAARHGGRLMAAALGALCVVLAGQEGVFAYSFIAAAAACTAALALRNPYLSGTAAGVALLFRPDVVIAACAAALLPRTGTERRRAALAGVGVAAGGWLVHSALAGPTTVLNVFLRDIPRTTAGRRLPLLPHEFGVAALLVAVFIAGIVLLIAASRQRACRAELLAMSLVVAGLLPQALQRADIYHIRAVAFVTVPLGLVGLGHLIARRPPRYAAISVWVLVLLLSTGGPVTGPAIRAAVGTTPTGTTVAVRDRSVVVSHEVAPSLRAALAAVDGATSDGDRLFVGVPDLSVTAYNDTTLYYLLGHLEPATYHLEFNPGSANRKGGRLAGDLASADVVVLSKYNWLGSDEPAASTTPLEQAPMKVLEARFCTIYESDAYEVLTPCTA